MATAGLTDDGAMAGRDVGCEAVAGCNVRARHCWGMNGVSEGLFEAGVGADAAPVGAISSRRGSRMRPACAAAISAEARARMPKPT